MLQSKEHFDATDGDAKFGVCSAGFQSCFGPVFSCYALFPKFCTGSVYLVPLYIRSMCSDFLLLQGIASKRFPESQKRLSTLEF